MATLRIHATAPGTWTVRYWPTDHPETGAETAPVTSSDQQIADWAGRGRGRGARAGTSPSTACAARASNPTPPTPRWSPGSTCSVASRRPTRCSSTRTAPRSIPISQLQPVGQNLLLASTSHAPDETVDLRAYLVGVRHRRELHAAEGGESSTAHRRRPCAGERAERNARQALPRVHREARQLVPGARGRDAAALRPLVPGRRCSRVGERAGHFESSVDRADRRPDAAQRRAHRVQPARRSHRRSLVARRIPPRARCARNSTGRQGRPAPVGTLCHPDSRGAGGVEARTPKTGRG